MERQTPLLELKQISKHFPGVLALNEVDFDLQCGEVHVLLGENGAGKSTLIKIISGAYRKDGGEIFIDGQATEIHSPRHAQSLGVATVYQEFNLVPFLSVAENIFLGHQPRKEIFLPVLDRKGMNREAKRLLESLDMEVNPKILVRDLGVAQKQMVEIAKACSLQARIFIFDEPTATLTFNEAEKLFEIIRRLKEEGIGIIYISHRLEEVFRIGTRITVMRNGEYVDTCLAEQTTTADLVELMIGRKMGEQLLRSQRSRGEEVLRLEGLSGDRFDDISLSVFRGEIVGLAGLVGAGRTELLRAIFGADKARSGSVYLNGSLCSLRGPRQSIRNRVALLPEDRKKHGLILCRSVEENISVSSLPAFSRFGVLRKGKIARRVKELIDRLSIKTPSSMQEVMFLSGGNQQKVIIARWLTAESDLILFDEPTRGIDVGAKQEVYALMHQLAVNGKAIVVVSSEIPELLQNCDRIYVMHEGNLKAEFDNKNLTTNTILNAAFGRVE